MSQYRKSKVNFALPNDIALPLRFPGLKPVGALALQPFTFSTSVALTGQPKSDTMSAIGERKTRDYCAFNGPRFVWVPPRKEGLSIQVSQILCTRRKRENAPS